MVCAADQAVGDDAEDSDDDPDFCDTENGGSAAAGHRGGTAVTQAEGGAGEGSRHHEADFATAARRGRPEPPVVGEVVERSPVLLEQVGSSDDWPTS